MCWYFVPVIRGADLLSIHGLNLAITDVANRGVTLGCALIDANHRLYCPAQTVRRDQMAAFLSRLAKNLFPTNCAAA